MATHSSILAWRILWTNSLAGCPWGHKESDMTKRLTRACTHTHTHTHTHSGTMSGVGHRVMTINEDSMVLLESVQSC